MMLKLFEYCVLSKIRNKINLNNRQFEFRRHSSRVMAITVLKETINSYTLNNFNLHAVVLDFIKAFNKVSHLILLNKFIIIILIMNY